MFGRLKATWRAFRHYKTPAQVAQSITEWRQQRRDEVVARVEAVVAANHRAPFFMMMDKSLSNDEITDELLEELLVAVRHLPIEDQFFIMPRLFSDHELGRHNLIHRPAVLDYCAEVGPEFARLSR